MTDRAHAAAVGHEVHLGKLEVKKDDRNLMLARYVDEQTLLPKVPKSTTWSKKVASWPMYGNDTLGDCTCAAVGHMEEIWSANAGQPEVPTDENVLDLYWATGKEDIGRYCLDVLNYWQQTGFGGERSTAFVQIEPTNRQHVELACWLFGGAYVGLALPVSAQHQQHGWTLATGPDAKPGSWGGHCVNLVDYTAKGPVCVTWGRRMPMAWDFFHRYCDEAYAVISPDWVGEQKKAPSGIALKQLQKDLAAIKSAHHIAHV